MTAENNLEASEMAAESNIEQAQLPASEEWNTCKPVDDADGEDAKSSASMSRKNSSFREESNHLSDLKDHERKALAELRDKLEDAILNNKLFSEEGEQYEKENICLWDVKLLRSEGSESTDVLLLKFLRAREFRVKEAFEMLQKTLTWRKESNIDSILSEEFDTDLSAACYMDGVDLEGHPVCYNVFGVFQDTEVYQKTFGSEEQRQKFLRWRVQLMETGIKKLEFDSNGVVSLLQIVDLKNSPGISKKELRTTMKQALDLLQDNYPEFVARNIIVNVPFWYYALHAVISPFLTQRTRSKFVFARPANVTETLLKYIAADQLPVSYGGLKRDNDTEFSADDGGVSELIMKANSIQTVDIPVTEVGATLVWDIAVLGWEVNYKEEFVPSDEGSYTVIIQKGKKMGAQEVPIRNSFRSNETGKVVLTIENMTYKKKKVLCRYKTKSV